MSAVSAFSLVELLAVTAVIVLLLGMGGLGLNQILQSSRMDQAGRMLVDEINFARQLATSRNRDVELRFIERSRNGVPSFHGLQSGWYDSAGTFVPATRLTRLPDGILFSERPELSSMIGLLPATNSPAPNLRHVAIAIGPAGFLEAQPGIGLNQPWFVTILRDRDSGKAIGSIDDFVTIQIDPWTARPSIYRP